MSSAEALDCLHVMLHRERCYYYSSKAESQVSAAPTRAHFRVIKTPENEDESLQSSDETDASNHAEKWVIDPEARFKMAEWGYEGRS